MEDAVPFAHRVPPRAAEAHDDLMRSWLPGALTITLLGGVVAGAIGHAVLGRDEPRYDIAAGASGVYRIDRQTGEVMYCGVAAGKGTACGTFPTRTPRAFPAAMTPEEEAAWRELGEASPPASGN